MRNTTEIGNAFPARWDDARFGENGKTSKKSKRNQIKHKFS